MPTSPISNSTAALGSPQKATTQLDREDQFGKDTFLKLLVAQLKYQNPMQPTDPSTFLTQSAQFSVVEKLSQLTTQGDSTSKLSQMTTAAAFIGKRVTYVDSNGQTVQGTVSAVKFPAGQPPTLKIGSTEISLTDVQGVDAGASA